MINSMEMAISSSTLSLPYAQISRPRTSQQQQSLSFSSSKSTFFSTDKTQLMTQWQWKRANCSVDLGRASKSRGLSVKCLFGLGVPELVVIGGVAALLFGPKQLPEVGRSIGKTVKSFQQAAKEFETELKKEPESPSEAPTAVCEEDEQEAKVPSMKESL